MSPQTHAAPCPACGQKDSFKSNTAVSFLKGDKRWIVECGHCGLSRLWPLPKNRELKAYYNQSYYNFHRHSEEGKGYYFAQLLKQRQKKGKVLDVGCATGFFLNGIQRDCSWEVYGLETGKGAGAYARKKLGLKVKDVPLERAGYPKDFFYFIHLNNVLEHVLDPAAVLAQAGRILKPGGRLFMAVPNGPVDRFSFFDYHRRFGKRAVSVSGHLYFFTPRSLYILAEKSGLRIEKAFGAGLKRTLKTFGYWPRRRGWEESYQGNAPSGKKVEQVVVEGKAYPKLYYRLKHGTEKLLSFPGFVPWAYDFTLYLTK